MLLTKFKFRLINSLTFNVQNVEKQKITVEK